MEINQNTSMKTKSQPKVTRVIVGRLFNLGNYENIKYEVEAYIPEGISASKTVLNILNAINALRPQTRIPTKADIHLREVALANMKKWNSIQWKRETGRVLNKHEIRRKLSEHAKRLKECIRTRKQAIAIEIRARKLLDNLGMTVTHKDAKEDWEDREF